MKIFIITFFLLSIHLQSYCQKSFTLASGVCNDSVLLSVKGKYRQQGDAISPEISSFLSRAQQLEVSRRLDAVHKLMQEAYPEPKGSEGGWHKNLNSYLFAHNYKFTTGIPTCNYSYSCGFLPYFCYQDQPNQVFYFSDAPSSCKVFANDWGELGVNMTKDSSLLINGLPFLMLAPVKKRWKGYELCYQNYQNSRTVMLHREGMLPYIPITRKQYLDYCIKRFNKMFDDMIKSSKEMPFSTQHQKDEAVKNITKQKNDVIKLYEKELEQNRAATLLDSAAIVRLLDNMYPDVPIFTTGAEDGSMLVIENPAYIRKDLPKYVPQFIVLYWSWVSDLPLRGGAQGEHYSKIIEANFPIEKLQAMIDK
ncbi:MAG: hypothetical protein ACXWWC_07150 [Chitinophagaceae bacterium]